MISVELSGASEDRTKMTIRILAILMLCLFLVGLPAYAGNTAQWGLYEVAGALKWLALGVFGAGLAIMTGLSRIARALNDRK